MDLSSIRFKLFAIVFVSILIAFSILLILSKSIPLSQIPQTLVTTIVPKEPITVDSGNTKVEIISEASNYQVFSTDKQQIIFVDAINKLGLNNFTKIPFQGERSPIQLKPILVSPASIQILIRPIENLDKDIQANSELSERLVYYLEFDNKKYASFFLGTFDKQNNSIKIPIYLDLDSKPNINSPKELLVSKVVLYSLYFNFQDKTYKEIGNLEQKVQDKVNLREPFLSVSKKLLYEKFNLVSDVNAQTNYQCGTASCQVPHSVKKCRYQGNNCFDNGDCTTVPGDYCNSTIVCGPDTQGVACTDTSFNCDAPSFVCAGGCSNSGNCSGAIGTPTPAPTIPPPTAPPPQSGCGIGCFNNSNCQPPFGAIPGGRAPICATSGSGNFCDDCTCYGNCDPAVSCTQTTWCGVGISCGPGERCNWSGSGGGYVRNPNNGNVFYASQGGWNCIPDIACQTCSLNLGPDPISITVGSNIDAVANITSQQNGTVASVTFVSGNSGIASANPTTDNSSPFVSSITGATVGTTTLTANGYMNGNLKCSDSVPVNINPPGPWWQAIGGDVISNANVVSLIPVQCTTPTCTPNLIKDGTGGFPGIVSYVTSYDFAADSGSGNASSKGWLVNSTLQQNKYSYSSFVGLVPSTVVINTITPGVTAGTTLTSGGTQSSDGYYWYKVTGDLTISSAANISGRKVVLLVDSGNLTINGNILVNTPGSDFFMALVGKDAANTKGNIIAGTTTTEIDGLYLADNAFQTGSTTAAIKVKGSISANTYSLQRDLGTNNTSTPAEVFEFSPAMLLAFPQSLLKSDINWQEIAP